MSEARELPSASRSLSGGPWHMPGKRMTQMPTLPLLERLSGLQASMPAGRLTFEGVTAVEIVAPDLQTAALLLASARVSFPAELVVDSGWIVRFRPPTTPAGDWVIELLALVERWVRRRPQQRAEPR